MNQNRQPYKNEPSHQQADVPRVKTFLPGSKQGFTLVEVILASALLGLFLFSALQILVMVSRTARLVQERTDATTLAWSRIERARNMQFEQVDDLAEGAPGTVINKSGLPEENGKFRRQTVITTETNGLVVKRLRIAVLPRNILSGEFDGSPEVVETLIADIPHLESDE